MSDTITTDIHLLRHGECRGGHIFRGSYDVELTARGVEQMRKSVDLILKDSTLKDSTSKEAQWEVIVSSPLKRCQRFAETTAKDLNVPLEIEEQLSEFSYGDWEGQEVSEVEKKSGDILNAWRSDPASVTPPNGEAIVDFRQRVSDGFYRTIQKHQGKRILLVVHGGVIRMILNIVLGMPLSKLHRFDVPFGCVSKISNYTLRGKEDITQLRAHNYLITSLPD